MINMANKFLIKNPIVTEKSTSLSGGGKYVFLVDNNASATEAKKAVEAIYKVKVIKTNVINTKNKTRRLGMSVGTKPGYKKIIMTLQKGQKLDVLPQ
ncbi:MAG: 50S ribosomal protein L23 [Candidatus Harrisonbacteria bacterium]|nr:50S ribosomal protein L23 [Candidatus Harrisonbacteria bacterium]